MKVWRCGACALLALSLLVSNAEAHEGWGIVVQPDGTVYFADIPTNTIWRITAAGVLEVAVSDKHSHALVRGADGSVYGTHEHSPDRPGEVWRITPDGQLSVMLTAPRDFQMSLHPFLIDASGAMYSTNTYQGENGPHQLMRRDPDGRVSVVAGSQRGSRDGRGIGAQFRGIDGMTFGPDGSIYVTDGPNVRRVGIDDVVTVASALTVPSWGEDLMGLAFTESGDLYVADYSSRRVVLIKPGLGVPATAALRSGTWWSPTGVAPQGTALHVLEHLRMPLALLGNIGVGPYVRVRRMAADGSVQTLATIWGRYTWIAGLTVVIVWVMLVVIVIRRRRRSRA